MRKADPRPNRPPLPRQFLPRSVCGLEDRGDLPLSLLRCVRVYSRDSLNAGGGAAMTAKLIERIETLEERLKQLKAKQARVETRQRTQDPGGRYRAGEGGSGRA